MFSGVVTGDIQNLIETSSRLTQATSRQQSEDFIHKQLTAFERLLQHAMSRYSNENLYRVLRQVAKWSEIENKPTQKHATKVAFKLRSINQLQDIMEAMKKKCKTKSSEDEHVFKHYELFLNDLLYLKDLKKYFNDEIHKELLKYHHDSTLENNSQTAWADSRQDELKGKMEDDDSGHGSQVETDDGKQGRKIHGTRRWKGRKIIGDDLIDSETKFKETVNNLQSILEKWKGLLSEDILDLNDFDPDSYHELMQFTNYSQFETILRMIPDMFAKCYKCIDLAKSWLKMSNIVMKKLPRDSTPDEPAGKDTLSTPTELEMQQSTTDFLTQVKDLQFQITNIKQSIKDDEKQLDKCNQEMDDLVGRDERLTTVSSEFSKIDSMITIAGGDYQKSKTEQYAVASKIRSCPKSSPSYAELKSHLQRLDSEVAQNHWKMKILEFEKSTVQEDYLVEMEVRPSFIRFVGDTKQRIQELERFLESKNEEKVKLEKQLALLKTNEERMRNIMQPHIGSASTISRKSTSITSESSQLSTFSEPDDCSVNINGDGNEADDDSPAPHDSHNASNTGTQPLSLESYILQKPKIVHSDKLRVRDLRPSSEKIGKDALKFQVKSKPVANVKFQNKGPKAALKTTPRRVWEDV